jgi:hypothetical protein
MTASARIRQYFVDEAGDAVLFDAKGRVIVGQEGCSKHFILGLLDVLEPDRLARELEELRQNLLADPYFRKVPSMQPEARKTALAFHAKDDLPEVRREVFSLLLRHRVRFLAVVRDKRAVLTEVTEHNRRDGAYRYHPNELYDYMVMRLCKTLLHKYDEYDIWFARRGSRDRTQALQAALTQARDSFAHRWGINSAAPIRVHAAYPHECVTLQATDYFLWALQRLYELRVDRFVELLWPAIELVQDVDDKREKPYGMYYDKKKPLTAAALEDLPGI